MRPSRIFSAFALGLVFVVLGFNRPLQRWTWFGLGIGFMLIGVLRWLKFRRQNRFGSGSSAPPGGAGFGG